MRDPPRQLHPAPQLSAQPRAPVRRAVRPALKRRWYADTTMETELFETRFPHRRRGPPALCPAARTRPSPASCSKTRGASRTSSTGERIVVTTSMTFGGRRISTALLTFELADDGRRQRAELHPPGGVLRRRRRARDAPRRVGNACSTRSRGRSPREPGDRTRVFDALGDPTRRAMVALLARGPVTVSALERAARRDRDRGGPALARARARGAGGLREARPDALLPPAARRPARARALGAAVPRGVGGAVRPARSAARRGGRRGP